MSPLNSGGIECAPKNVALTVAGVSHPSDLMTRNILSSFSRSKPYPDLTSTVVVPGESFECLQRHNQHEIPRLNMACKCLRRFSANSSSVACRVARTVECMPPPAA